MIVNILILIPEIVLNALVLIAYAKNIRQHVTYGSVTEWFLCLLSHCGLPKRYYNFFVTFNCYIWVVDRLLLQGTCGVSLLIIVVLSLERFVTLAYPFRSQLGITRFRLKVVISVSIYIALDVRVMWSISTVWLRCTCYSRYFYHIFCHCRFVVIVIWLWIHRLLSRHEQQIVTFQLAASTVRSFKTVIRNTKTSYLVSELLGFCAFLHHLQRMFIYITCLLCQELKAR
jgi:hypothetical protein